MILCFSGVIASLLTMVGYIHNCHPSGAQDHSTWKTTFCIITIILFQSGVRLVRLDSFWGRPLSGSKEDTYEVQRRMQLHDEQSNRPMFGNVNDGVSVGRCSRTHDITESSNQNSRKRTVQEYNYLYTYLSTILYALIMVIESIFRFRWIHHSHSSISFFWLESCVIALFFKICRRKRIARLVVQKKSVQLLMWWWTGLKKSVAWIICDLTNDKLPFLTIASQIDCRNSYKVRVT